MSEKVQKRLSFIINIAYAAVVLALVYLALKYVVGWVLPFLLAFCIVTALNPLIQLIRKNLRIKQEIVSLIVMILIYALLAVLLFLLVMQLFILIRDGLLMLPAYYEQSIQPALTRAGNSLMDFLDRLPPEWQEQIAGFQSEIMKTLQGFLVNLSQWSISAVSSITVSVPSFLISFVFTIMLSFFISMQYGKVVAFLRSQLPDRAAAIVRDLRVIVIETVFKYFKAAITLMVITFVELSVGLMLLRTANAIPVAAGIAVFDALPFLGTGAIMIPWAAVELLQGNYRYAFGIAILYAIVTVIRNIIEPKIVGDKLGLNPIVSLTAIYLGFKVFGVLGMIVMPILTQIVIDLHKKGSIRLFRETDAGPAASPPGKEEDAPS